MVLRATYKLHVLHVEHEECAHVSLMDGRILTILPPIRYGKSLLKFGLSSISNFISQKILDENLFYSNNSEDFCNSLVHEFTGLKSDNICVLDLPQYNSTKYSKTGRLLIWYVFNIYVLEINI